MSIISNDFVFTPPFPGKPNPNEPYSQDRSRVVYNGQKGQTCFYYACQLLRDNRRIGKHPTEEFQEERRIEKVFSEHEPIRINF